MSQPQNDFLLFLPEIPIENIFSFLSYDEIAKNRSVCRKFNEIGSSLLSRGFFKLERRYMITSKRIKSKLPRRESARINHPLSRHYEILQGIEFNLGMFNMTYTPYIDKNLICFIPGKVLDEAGKILEMVDREDRCGKAGIVLQELRDLSGMAIKHFDENFLWECRTKLWRQLAIPEIFLKERQFAADYPVPLRHFQEMELKKWACSATKVTRMYIHQLLCAELYKVKHVSEVHQRHIPSLTKKSHQLCNKFKEKNSEVHNQDKQLSKHERQIQEQNSKIMRQKAKLTDIKKHMNKWDQKCKYLSSKLVKAREKIQLKGTKIKPRLTHRLHKSPNSFKLERKRKSSFNPDTQVKRKRGSSSSEFTSSTVSSIENQIEVGKNTSPSKGENEFNTNPKQPKDLLSKREEGNSKIMEQKRKLTDIKNHMDERDQKYKYRSSKLVKNREKILPKATKSTTDQSVPPLKSNKNPDILMKRKISSRLSKHTSSKTQSSIEKQFKNSAVGENTPPLKVETMPIKKVTDSKKIIIMKRSKKQRIGEIGKERNPKIMGQKPKLADIKNHMDEWDQKCLSSELVKDREKILPKATKSSADQNPDILREKRKRSSSIPQHTLSKKRSEVVENTPPSTVEYKLKQPTVPIKKDTVRKQKSNQQNRKILNQANKLCEHDHKIQEQNSKMMEQKAKLVNFKKHMDEWDQKYKHLSSELSEAREKILLKGTKSTADQKKSSGTPQLTSSKSLPNIKKQIASKRSEIRKQPIVPIKKDAKPKKLKHEGKKLCNCKIQEQNSKIMGQKDKHMDGCDQNYKYRSLELVEERQKIHKATKSSEDQSAPSLKTQIFPKNPLGFNLERKIKSSLTSGTPMKRKISSSIPELTSGKTLPIIKTHITLGSEVGEGTAPPKVEELSVNEPKVPMKNDAEPKKTKMKHEKQKKPNVDSRSKAKQLYNCIKCKHRRKIQEQNSKLMGQKNKLIDIKKHKNLSSEQSLGFNLERKIKSSLTPDTPMKRKRSSSAPERTTNNFI